MHSSTRRSTRRGQYGPIIYFSLQSGGRGARSFGPSQRDQLSGLVSSSLEACNGLRVHAFSWTTSEIRIAVEGGHTELQRFTREMAVLHRAHLHESLCGAACLFERSYSGAPVDSERDLIHAIEHIHEAPVHAGLAAYAADYRWSSCRAYLGLETVPWLTTGLVSKLIPRPRRGTPYAGRRLVNEPPEACRSPL